MLLATVFNIVSLMISISFLTRVTAGISRDLRADLFEKIIDWSKETRTSFSNSTLITRTVNDVKQVSNFIDLSLRKIFTLSITVIGALAVSFFARCKIIFHNLNNYSSNFSFRFIFDNKSIAAICSYRL